MSSGPVLVEQRLRSAGLAVVLALVLAVFINFGVIFTNTTDGNAVPTVALVVSYSVLALLFAFFLLAIRIVVRVVEVPQGRVLEILYGPGGLVRQVFGPGQLQSASAQDLSFMEMGGWGYRGSLKFLKRAALVTRRGDALELSLAKKRRFIVTVDDPAAFVTALGFGT
jgi:hypothetical protein